jgi:hypothetical protein
MFLLGQKMPSTILFEWRLCVKLFLDSLEAYQPLNEPVSTGVSCTFPGILSIVPSCTYPNIVMVLNLTISAGGSYLSTFQR